MPTAKVSEKRMPRKSPPRKPGSKDKNEWRRKYYVPDDKLLKAARDLFLQSTPSEIQEYAGRMFALQDLVDQQRLDEIALLEKESADPAYLEIVRAVRREAPRGDPEYARSIAGEFLEQAFRVDSGCVRAWFRYQNRIRQQRIDAGLGLIDPPDRQEGCSECGERVETLARLQVGTLEIRKLRVRRLKVDKMAKANISGKCRD
jgi:hypothetical protein